MLESKFQTQLKKDLQARFPGCLIMKSDPGDIQGLPDLFVFYNDKWAALEVKRSATASVRPNQQYYVDMLNHMSFSAFVCPENKEEILDALQQTFGA